MLLGDSGVGKSCIVLRFVRGQFDPTSKVGVLIFSKFFNNLFDCDREVVSMLNTFHRTVPGKLEALISNFKDTKLLEKYHNI